MSYRLNNYYNILGLQENCSTKQIKEAFLTLSKQFHPDTSPQDPNLHKKFVLINEAYSVLSKPLSRREYDVKLDFARRIDPRLTVETDSPNPFTVHETSDVFRDESIWHMRDRSKDKFYKSNSYYGIKGIPKLPNLIIASGAILIMGLGAMFHYFTLRKSFSMSTAVLDERDLKNASLIAEARENAKANGNDLQLKILEEKLKKN